MAFLNLPVFRSIEFGKVVNFIQIHQRIRISLGYGKGNDKSNARD